MKPFRLGLILEIVAVSFLSAQSVSPLYQVMTTNSLIARPEVFREMQENLDAEFGKKTAGLQLEGLHEVFGDIRQHVINLVGTPHVVLTSAENVITITDSVHWLLRIQLPADDTLNKIWTWMSGELSSRLADRMNNLLSPLNKTATSAAFVDALVQGLLQSNLAARIDVKRYQDLQGTRKLSWILVAIMMKDLREKVERELSIYNIRWREDLKRFCESVEKYLVEISTQVRNDLITQVNNAETALSNVVDDVSHKLIAANSGVGITKGQGSFSGGIYLTAYHNTNWQFALYANGQLNQGDSTKPVESLMGGHIRFGSERFEYDLLFAILFGDKQFRAWSSGEIGLGLSSRLGGVIAGSAVYILGSKIMHPQFTVGLTLRPATPGGTAFLLGLQGQNGNWQPIVQTSFPILAK